jgi:sugar phosphate isomerase/epimerase
MIVGDRFHLTYCSNIHRGHTWDEVDTALRASLPNIRQQLGVDGPFAVGLRLSADAADELSRPERLEQFRAFLDNRQFYVPTINGFPYGAFHGSRVKEDVYRPDWREAARVRYSNRLADILATLLTGTGMAGSVSTVPGAFRSEVGSADTIRAIAANVLRHAAHLVALRDRTGVTVTLAIEPEPSCAIETTAELARFFENYLLDAETVDAVARETGVPLAAKDVIRHVGACLDTCHMAVEFEDPSAALDLLRQVGMQVFKIQVSSALDLAQSVPPVIQSVLGPFAEDTYLHQVVARTSGRLTRYTDLPEALSAVQAQPADVSQDWRVHFHVPLFLADMDRVRTTQSYVVSVLELLKRDPFCTMLEVETYTWDVLPAEYRRVDQCTAIARELSWTRKQLEA